MPSPLPSKMLTPAGAHGKVGETVAIEIPHHDRPGAALEDGDAVVENTISVARQHADRTVIIRHGSIRNAVAIKIPQRDRARNRPAGNGAQGVEGAVAVAQQHFEITEPIPIVSRQGEVGDTVAIDVRQR